MPRNGAGHGAGRGHAMALAALAYLVFVAYGSLVPLVFHPRPLDQAWSQFLHIPYLDLGVGQRADWVANIVLYVPLSFLGLAALAGGRDTLFGRAAKTALVFCGCVAVAVGIEFFQQFFPPRTVSLNDLVAETLGSAAGLVLWHAAGRRLLKLGAEIGTGGANAGRAMLLLYVLGYLALSFFPYDFVVSWPELSLKLAAGRDSLLVSAGSCGSGLHCAAKLASEVIAVLPVGLLIGLRCSGARDASRIALRSGLALGLSIEAVQLFIESGAAQGISVATRVAGTLLGLLLYRQFSAARVHALQPYLRPGVGVLWPLYLAVLAGLTGWFGGSWLGLQAGLGRIAEVNFLPFYYHYYTSEGAALTSLLRNVAIYLPAGLAYWAWIAGKPYGVYSGSAVIAGALGGVLALAMESSKLFLADKRPDPTDILLAIAAASLAYAVAAWTARRFRAAQQHAGKARS